MKNITRSDMMLKFLKKLASMPTMDSDFDVKHADWKSFFSGKKQKFTQEKGSLVRHVNVTALNLKKKWVREGRCI